MLGSPTRRLGDTTRARWKRCLSSLQATQRFYSLGLPSVKLGHRCRKEKVNGARSNGGQDLSTTSVLGKYVLYLSARFMYFSLQTFLNATPQSESVVTG